MRCGTSPSPFPVIAGLVAVLALGQASSLAAEASRGAPAAPTGPGLWLDLLPTALGLALGAAELRGGLETGARDGLSLAAELGAYYGGPDSAQAWQADLETGLRWRPLGRRGPFLGAGLGLALVASSGMVVLDGLVLAEAGWCLSPPSSRFRLEPLARLTAALGRDSLLSLGLGLRLYLDLAAAAKTDAARRP